MSLYNMMVDLLGPTHAAGVPGIAIKGGGNSPDEGRSDLAGAKLRLHKLAVFREGKQVGWLSAYQSRGLLWARGGIDETVISFPCPGGGQKRNSVLMSKVKGKIKPVRAADGRWTMKLGVQATGTLTEYSCGDKLADPAVIQFLEDEIRKEIEAEMTAGIKGAQQLKADITGMGQAIRLEYPKEWKSLQTSWNEDQFPGIRSEPQVSVKLAATGRSFDSYKQASSRGQEGK